MNGMHDLDDLFAAARAAPPPPSEALVARVLADAGALQPRAAPLRRAPQGGGFWAALGAAFGGGGMLAGLGTAAAAGLFLGFVQPVPVTALTDALGVTSADLSYEFLPGIDPLIAEE